MRIADVPATFRPKRSRRNDHDHNYGVAEAFYDHVLAGNDADTDLIYLPVFWAGGCHHQSETTGNPAFGAVPALQEYLDTQLDPNESYFTVMRNDEGAYETLPDNVLVFGACGESHISIPLTTELPLQPHSLTGPTHLAGFAGCSNPGGPPKTEIKPSHSVRNPGGIGTRVRRLMIEEFQLHKDTLLATSGRLDWPRFVGVVTDSVFALAPRGYGRTSFRLYEAMAFRRIPVYISDDFCLPYADELDWDEFCVLCDYGNIAGLYDRLASTSLKWRINAVETIERLYTTHFSLGGTCRQIINSLESM